MYYKTVWLYFFIFSLTSLLPTLTSSAQVSDTDTNCKLLLNSFHIRSWLKVGHFCIILTFITKIKSVGLMTNINLMGLTQVKISKCDRMSDDIFFHYFNLIFYEFNFFFTSFFYAFLRSLTPK